MNASLIQNEKGIALMIALMVLIMLSLMGLAAILTGTTDIQIASNAAHSTQTLYLAEAGVGQVKSWFETPTSFNPPAGSYTLIAGYNMAPYANGDMQSFFRKRRNTGADYLVGNVSQFTDINNNLTVDAADANNQYDDNNNSATAVDPTNLINGDHPTLSITDATAGGSAYLNDPTTGLFKDLLTIGKIKTLEVYPPMRNTNFATVRVTAEDNSKVTRTIEQEIGPSLNFSVTGGLSAQGAAGWNGNGSVHWGPIVTLGNVTTGQNSVHCKTGSCSGGADKWWSLDAAGTVAVTNLTLPDPNYAITQNSTKTPQTLSSQQKTDLKQYSVDTGQYYVYCSTDGLLHKADASGNPTSAGTSFENLTNGKTFDMLYVDIGAISPSCNPTTPAMPTFNIGGGGGYYTASNIILNGNFSLQGLGGTTNIPDAQNPDQVAGLAPGYTPLSAHINGLIYTTGSFNSGGNPVVYGAVVAEGGFTGSGTPDIWYNANLNAGLPALPKTSTQGWREIRK